MPDKVAADNRTGYAPGAIESPMADHAWDNGPFAALLLAELFRKWTVSKEIFCTLEPRARRALEFLNLSKIALADVVRTSLGPRGMDKMIQDGKGQVLITNDGATILKQIQVVHPTAKMVCIFRYNFKIFLTNHNLARGNLQSSRY